MDDPFALTIAAIMALVLIGAAVAYFRGKLQIEDD